MSFAADSWVTTSVGAFQLENLPFRATHLMLGKLKFPFTSHSTHRRRCLRLETKAGYEITVAEDQRLFALVYRGVPAEAQAQWLKPGMFLALDEQRGDYSGEGCWEAGFLSGCASSIYYPSDNETNAKVQECLELFGVRTLRDFKECSSKDIEVATSAGFVAGYLSGLCNVSALMDPEISEQSVSFRRPLPALKMLQRVLLRHGIRSRLNPRDDKPDIVIPNTAIKALGKEVSWFHPKRAEQFASLHPAPALPFQDEIVSIAPTGVQDTCTINTGYVGRAAVNGFLCVA
jgi:hypothetical protein